MDRRRLSALALAGLLALPLAALARPFDVRVLSATNVYQLAPVVADSGLIAWIQRSKLGDDGDDGAQSRTDVLVSDNGAEPVNITKDDPALAGRMSTPSVCGQAVAFSVQIVPGNPGGPEFKLVLPELDEKMQQMEDDYPTLFGETPPSSATIAQIDADTPEAAAIPEGAADAEPELDENGEPIVKPIAAPPRQNWRAGMGNSLSIALYENGQIEFLTPTNQGFSIPALGEKHVACLCARGWPYGYEMVTYDREQKALTQLTTNFFYVACPVMSGHRLAFQGWDGNDYEIFVHDFDTGVTTQITDNTFDDTDPALDGDTLGWIGHPLVTAEIFMYDFESQSVRKLSDSSTTANTHLSVWDGKAVWQAYDDEGADSEIYYYDGKRIIKLTSNIWDDTDPCIRDGVIAWVSYVDLGDAEIMALDLSDNIPVQITDNASDDLHPCTARSMVVWQSDTDDGHSLICIATPHVDGKP